MTDSFLLSFGGRTPTEMVVFLFVSLYNHNKGYPDKKTSHPSAQISQALQKRPDLLYLETEDEAGGCSHPVSCGREAVRKTWGS